MGQLLQAITSGILYGSIYGLMAMGLTLVWGSLRLLNMAHGALYLAGGYLAWAFVHGLALPVIVALPAAVLGAAAIGVVLQTVLITPMLAKPGWDSASIIATVGASISMESGALLLFGPETRKLPGLVDGQVMLGGVSIEWHKILVVVVALLCLHALDAFLRRSRHGLAIRAVAQNMDAARLMGVPVRRVFAIVMGLSAALAGLAGVLLTPIYYLSPGSGFDPMLKALVVTIFGGLGSTRGTLHAAYLIGLLEAFLQVYLGAGWALPGIFLFVILILAIRPSGLCGLGEAQRL